MGHFQRIFLAVVLLAAGATPVACSGGAATRGGAEGLPRWEGEDQRAFTDDIDPDAVGLSMEHPSPRSDGFLRQRAQTADLVARVRVQTVTVDSVGDARTYHLGVQIAQPPIAGTGFDEETLELTIRPTSPAFGVVKALDTRLQGMTFVAFLKRFADPDGEPRVHFHFSADSAEVAAAVRDAVALQEISGS